jgi:Tol biopolymer transport system component
MGGLMPLVNASAPTWSPDGKQIAFAYNFGGYRIVRRSSRPGGAVRTVLGAPYASHGCCEFMTWGRGDRIFVSPHGGLESVDVHGGKPKRLVLLGFSQPPGWPVGFMLSPNREYLGVMVWTDDTPSGTVAMYLVKLRSRQVPVEVTSPLSGQLWASVVAFSPDSRQVVYWSCLSVTDTYPPGCAASGLLAARLPDGTPVPLAQSGIPGAALVPNDVGALQWSPDGRWIAYDENGSLEVVPATGTNPPRTLATCDPNFSWSPNSKLIAIDCTSQSGASGQLTTERPDGTHLTNPLSNHHLTYDGGVQWSPDGSRLLILAHSVDNPTTRVWTIRPNGHDLAPLS